MSSLVLTGSQQKDFMGIQVICQEIRGEGMNFYRLKGGLVTDIWAQYDSAGLWQQIDAIPARRSNQLGDARTDRGQQQ